jgi:hypothetical protein
LAEKGQLDEAYERMQRLAPENEAGFPAAHGWILQQMLLKTLDVPEEERLRAADVHFNHLKKLGARGPDIDFLRAVWFAQSERLEEASAAFAPLINRNPHAAMERLRIDLVLGRQDEARRDARAVRQHMQDAEREKKPIDAEQYKAWAVAEELLGDAEKLGPVVRQWHAAAPDDPGARRGVAMLDMQEFTELLQSPNPNPRVLADRLVEMTKVADRSVYQPVLTAWKARSSLPGGS